jgi:hypothetical protein
MVVLHALALVLLIAAIDVGILWFERRLGLEGRAWASLCGLIPPLVLLPWAWWMRRRRTGKP